MKPPISVQARQLNADHCRLVISTANDPDFAIVDVRSALSAYDAVHQAAPQLEQVMNALLAAHNIKPTPPPPPPAPDPHELVAAERTRLEREVAILEEKKAEVVRCDELAAQKAQLEAELAEAHAAEAAKAAQPAPAPEEPPAA